MPSRYDQRSMSAYTFRSTETVQLCLLVCLFGLRIDVLNNVNYILFFVVVVLDFFFLIVKPNSKVSSFFILQRNPACDGIH